MNRVFGSINLKMEYGWMDKDAEEIYQAAINSIASARMDGQSSGKHSPESWQEEIIENQVNHAKDHVYNTILFNEFLIKEAEHALCRLAIAIALFKRQENKN